MVEELGSKRRNRGRGEDHSATSKGKTFEAKKRTLKQRDWRLAPNKFV